jgi:ABC-2 type transport system permease protein
VTVRTATDAATHAAGTGPAWAPGRLRAEARTLTAVIHRDLLRLVTRPVHTALLLLKPLLFLLLLGSGLASLVPHSATGGDYRTYLFPGILVMTVQSAAAGVGVRLITDRDSGYLRETLMTPARRTTLLLGRCLGGTIVALAQGTVLLAFAGTAHLPYQPALLAALLAIMALTAFTTATLTATLAITLHNIEIFNIALSLSMFPLLVLSGAFFPLTALPGWLIPLTALNPLAYAVDLMQRTINAHTSHHLTHNGTSWAGWIPPAPLQIAALAALAALTLLIAARRFARPQ